MSSGFFSLHLLPYETSPSCEKAPLISGAAHDFPDISIISSEGGQSPQVADAIQAIMRARSRGRRAADLRFRSRRDVGKGCLCLLRPWHELHAASRKCFRPPCALRTVASGARPPDVLGFAEHAFLRRSP